MKIKEILSELRKNPKQNVKLDTFSELQKIASQYGTDNVYVRFTNLPKSAKQDKFSQSPTLTTNVNPKYKTTPLAIYAYPLSYILGLGIQQYIPYQAEAEFVMVFKDMSNPSQHLHISIDESDVNGTLDKLERLLDASNAFAKRKYNAEEQDLYDIKDDAFSDLDDWEDPEGIPRVFSLIFHKERLTNDDKMISLDSPRDMSIIFRMAGFTTVTDESGSIHTNEAVQAMFFDSSKLKVIKTLLNRSKKIDLDDFDNLPIAGDPTRALQIEQKFKRNDPNNIQLIMSTPFTAFKYCTTVLKDRWPEAEPILKKDPEIWKKYQDLFIDNHN